MGRKRAIRKLEDLVVVATQVFKSKGYRRTQMADVTNAMGLSPGTLYRYVTSKEALFDLIVRVAASPDFPLEKVQLPVRTPRPGSTLRFVREMLAREGRVTSLENALAGVPLENPGRELENVIRELYAKTARFRVGIKLMERSALDWPRLAAVWFGEVRKDLIDHIARYMEIRVSQGYFRPVPDPTAAARLIVETVAFFAMHRHDDPYPTPLDDGLAEATVVDAIVNAYAMD